MRLVQHKIEAFWFYRFLSMFYDNYVNPFFWNEPMRKEALNLAKLNSSKELKVVDVGAGTGFTTLGIIQYVKPENVTMLDQSPHQLEKAEKKPKLSKVKKILGDAENLPFKTDQFDRYISAGSIEYWPDPIQGIAESYRVIKPGGYALNIGPLQIENRIFRFFSDMWMLFPSFKEYIKWYQEAGFTDIKYKIVAPEWLGNSKFALAIVGRKDKPGKSPYKKEKDEEISYSKMTFSRRIKFWYRFVFGSFFGFIFVPIAFMSTLKNKKRQLKAQKK